MFGCQKTHFRLCIQTQPIISRLQREWLNLGVLKCSCMHVLSWQQIDFVPLSFIITVCQGRYKKLYEAGPTNEVFPFGGSLNKSNMNSNLISEVKNCCEWYKLAINILKVGNGKNYFPTSPSRPPYSFQTAVSLTLCWSRLRLLN